MVRLTAIHLALTLLCTAISLVGIVGCYVEARTAQLCIVRIFQVDCNIVSDGH
jgi:cytochrome b561